MGPVEGDRGVERLWRGLTEEAQQAVTDGWYGPGLYEISSDVGDGSPAPTAVVEADSVPALIGRVHEFAIEAGEPTWVSYVGPLPEDEW